MAKLNIITGGFLFVFLAAPSFTAYVSPQPPQLLQPPQIFPQQQSPSPSTDDLNFLFNLMNVFDPSTLGLSWLTNSVKLYDAVPHCYNKHQDIFGSLKNRVLAKPTRCFAQPMDKLMDHMTETFFKTMKAYVKLTEYMDRPNGNNDIFALMQFITDEKQLAMEILDDLNYLLNSTYPLVGSPTCVVDEAVDVYGEYQGKFNEALYCLQEQVTERPKNMGFK